MRFQPKTEKDLASMNLLPKGNYEFTIIEAKETVSKKGSPMMVLTLGLFDQISLQPRGRVYDYLLESMPHKLRHAAFGVGLGEKYEAGNIEASDFQGKNGTAVIGIQQDKTGNYPDKNVVVDYLTLAQDGTQKLQQKADKFTEDDIPF